MNACRRKNRVEAILDDLITLLDIPRLQETICAPLERAAQSFSSTIQAEGGLNVRDSFFSRYGEFVRHLYAYGIRPPRNLSEHEGQVEAVAIVDGRYQSQSGQGCSAAWMDYQVEDGDTLLQDFLLEAIKRLEWQKHVRWMAHGRFALIDWGDKVALVRAFQARLRDYLGPRVATGPPEQYVDLLPQLLLDWMDAHNEIDGSLRPSNGIH